MKVTIFYSWQSDLPNNTNRGFIEGVIKTAIAMIKRQETYELDLCLERDTQGVPGSPNIAATILDKISACDIFVADISIVTGDSAKEQRPSPNPNVLIELGYAIARLGWNRIILFCNELYGNNQDLPFDIRQHRRISYRLKPEDVKNTVRDELTKTLTKAIIDITETLSAHKNLKEPDLTLDWTNFEYVPSKETRNGIAKTSNRTNLLLLPRSKPIGDIESILKKEMEDIKLIDGHIDPRWDEKVKDYFDECNAFINKVTSGLIRLNYLIQENRNLVVETTLTLANIGTSPATDLRAEIIIPDWLLAFEEFPDKNDIPIFPSKPIPLPRCFYLPKFIAISPSTEFGPSDLTTYINRKSGCHIEKKSLTMWADKLLHKNDLTNKHDRFYLLALPNVELGDHKLIGRVFCGEFNDWKEVELLVKITEAP